MPRGARLARGLSKRERLRAAEVARQRPSGRTRLLGGLAGGAVLTVVSAEVLRVWRLGTLPRGRDASTLHARPRNRATEALIILREGYSVSRTREDAAFNMLAAFTTGWTIARGITWYLREHPSFGPFRDLKVGERHIHHFVPGGLIGLGAGAAAIGIKDPAVDKWLAIPFGVGVALVLDESALLLELEDVYWTEEGVLSVQIAFAAMAAFAALTYLFRIVRTKDKPSAESDWQIAARAWDDLQFDAGDPSGFGIGE